MMNKNSKSEFLRLPSLDLFTHILQVQLYNRRAATAPIPASAPPTLMLEAEPVNRGYGGEVAPVPDGAAVPTVDASGTSEEAAVVG
jgi:hypothetical protein